MGKRSNGEGSFSKLPSGNWRGQIMDGYTPEGKRNIVNFIAPTKSEVQQKIRQYLSDRENGVVSIRKEMPFQKWADLWYADYKGHVQDSTYSDYKYTLNLLKKKFQDTPINQIKQLSVNRYLADMFSQGYSYSQLSKCKAMLIQIFDAAEQNELITKNPARYAKIQRLNWEEEKESKDAFTEEEFQRIMQYLSQDLIGNCIRVLLTSGLRVQELLALTPEDIAEDGSWIRVNKAVKRVDGKAVLGVPKSKRSNRVVPISEEYREYACYIRNHGGRVYILTSIHSESMLYTVGSFRRMYYRKMEEVAGVRKLTPHCCRHTYVTRLQAKGVAMDLIARLVGHADIETTDHYTHTSLETLSKAVKGLNGTDTSAC